MTEILQRTAGSTITLSVTATDSSGSPLPLTTRSVIFRAASDVDISSPTIELDSISNPSQIDITDALAGEATITLVPSDTSPWINGPAFLSFEVWLSNPDDIIFSGILSLAAPIGAS